MEATHYYDGLPSRPRLVARTSTTPWEMPDEADKKFKQLGPASSHKIGSVWNDVGPKVYGCLDKMGVQWTSIDIVRIGFEEEYRPPVILWIGVKPGYLAGEYARTVAFTCLDILKESEITDVDVEIRELLVFPLVDISPPPKKGKNKGKNKQKNSR